MMRILLLTVIFYLPVSATASDEIGVASINLCADQLVMLLAEDEQILSLSNLSQQEAGSYYFERAREYPVNEGNAEQILNLQPDIVIAGQYSSPHTLALLREVGLQVHILPIANSIEQMFENIESVSRWVGQEERGRGTVAYLKEKLSWRVAVEGPRLMAAAFDPNGYTSGASSLRGEVIELAGFRNAASEAGIESYGKLSLEALINLNPDALIESPYSPGTWSRAQAMSQHPALRSAGIDPQIIPVPSRMMVCAGPWTLDVIEQLDIARIELMSASQ